MQARNTMQCPRMPDIIEGLAGPVAHACIPLKFEGSTKGVLNVAARPGELFAEEELRFLETLGHQVGLAVERARHREAESRKNQEARAMAAVSKAIGSSLDVDAVLHAVGDTAREILDAERVAIMLGSDPRSLTVAHLSGLPHPELKEGEVLDLVGAGSRLQVRALEERRAFWVDDWSRDERISAELAQRWDAASGIIVPLLAREGTLGLLLLTRTAPHRWQEEQVETAEALAAHASVAMENARLYQESRAAYQELKDAQEKIIQTEKMAVLGTFASGLAHEVRNPLNSIGLQLALLERRIGKVDGQVREQLAEISHVIREEVRRLDGLVGDFLLFSRADRIQHGPANLDLIVDDVLKLLGPEAAGVDVTLTHETGGGRLPILRVDAEKMKQVVINLVRNAIEAMPDGGAVVVETGTLDGHARLVVRDTGPGLPEGLDIFQLFVTTKAKGTGLGLSIVQQIVVQHGGTIAVASEPGRGASFIVTLPMKGSREGVGR
jgi:signal transduction histidine kinase